MSFTDFKEVSSPVLGTGTKYGSQDLLDIMQIFNGKIVASKRPRISNQWLWQAGFDMAETTAPATPAAGNQRLFIDSADHVPKLKNSSGVITSIGSSSSNIQDYDYYIYKNGANYTAVSGGNLTPYTNTNADFKTVFQAVIDNISPAGTPTLIVIGPGDFILHSQLTIPQTRIGNIHIKGLGAGNTNIKIGSGFNSLGSLDAIFIGTIPAHPTGSTGTLTANCTAKSDTLTMSTTDVAKFAINDFVLLNTNTVFSPALSGQAFKGEIHKIIDKPNTTTLTLDTPAFQDYLTTETALLYKFAMLQNILIADLTIAKDSGLTSNTVRFLQVYFSDNVTFNNVNLVDNVSNYYGGLTLTSCINSAFTNCYLLQNVANPYNLQYGICIQACCQNCIVDHCRSFGAFRHAFEMSNGFTSADRIYAGQARGITCSNSTGQGSIVATFDCHADGENISFENCSALGTTATLGFVGMEMRSRRPRLINCLVDSADDMGYEILEEATGAKLINCIARNCSNDGLHIFAGTNNVQVLGGEYSNNTGQGIEIETGTVGTTIMGTTVRGNTNHGLLVNTNCTDTQIVGGVYSNNTNEGIYLLSGSNRSIVKSITASSNTSNGIRIQDSDNCIIEGNICTGNTNQGIYLNTPTLTMTNTICSNNNLVGNTSTALTIDANVGGNTILKDNFGYNPRGNIATPWPSATGDLRNAASTNAAPVSAAVYTNRFTSKSIVISGGTVSAISVNGSNTGETAGVFKLAVGETISVTYSVTPTVSVVRGE